MKEKQQPPLHRYTASQPGSRGCTGGRKEEQYWEERATFDKKALSEQTTKRSGEPVTQDGAQRGV